MRKGVVDGFKLHETQIDNKEIDIFLVADPPTELVSNGSFALETGGNNSAWFRKNAQWLALGYQVDIDQNATDITTLQSSISGFETIERYQSKYIGPNSIVLPSGSGVTRKIVTGSNGLAYNVLSMPTSTQVITTEPFILENWDGSITNIAVRVDLHNDGTTTSEEIEIDCTLVQLKTGDNIDKTPDDYKTVAFDSRSQYVHDQSFLFDTFSGSNTNMDGNSKDAVFVVIRRRGGEDECTEDINISGVWVSWQTAQTAFAGAEAGDETGVYANTLSTDFPGSSGNIASTGTYTDMSGHSDFTISMWFKSDLLAVSNIRQGLFYLGTNSGNYYSAWLLPIGGTSWRLYTYSNGAFKWYNGFNNDTNWKHLAFVRSGTSETVYIDGSSVSTGFATGTFSGTSPAGSIAMNLGVWGTTAPTSNPANGKIDEVATWDTSLSVGNISTLFANTDFANTVQPGNCVNYWRMGDGDTLFTVTDQQAVANLTVGASCTFVADVP